ncbi:hypothetical protein Pmani_034077 [Petrolisthes manimaculis]|uniref:Uncharacterized protein n=1 Tax=Petrolisthes manimaculis TaxID=1843537 RepID=A0AAE1TRZ6_9EUCA|nr:hypothetical protein Pmani_034077 [Petrolisthes manimaculis]
MLLQYKWMAAPLRSTQDNLGPPTGPEGPTGVLRRLLGTCRVNTSSPSECHQGGRGSSRVYGGEPTHQCCLHWCALTTPLSTLAGTLTQHRGRT